MAGGGTRARTVWTTAQNWCAVEEGVNKCAFVLIAGSSVRSASPGGNKRCQRISK
jgi:hypothetical protein